MFGTLYKDRTLLQTPIGKNSYNEMQYSSKLIKCRFEERERKVYSQNGDSRLSSTTVYVGTKTDVKLGDLINGRRIMSIRKITNSRGKEEGKEILLL